MPHKGFRGDLRHITFSSWLVVHIAHSRIKQISITIQISSYFLMPYPGQRWSIYNMHACIYTHRMIRACLHPYIHNIRTYMDTNMYIPTYLHVESRLTYLHADLRLIKGTVLFQCHPLSVRTSSHMYVYMYIYVYVCMYMYTTYIYPQIYIETPQVWAVPRVNLLLQCVWCMYVCMNVFLCMYVCMHVCMFILTITYLHRFPNFQLPSYVYEGSQHIHIHLQVLTSILLIGAVAVAVVPG